MTRVLVTGAFGQIGTELTRALRYREGDEEVLASGRHPRGRAAENGPSMRLDVTDAVKLADAMKRHGAQEIYHLAAQLSAHAEQDPLEAWRVNMDGLRNVLEAGRRFGARVFWPSSIAAFGPDTPRDPAPQDTVMRPTTIYGISKVAGELLCDYYARRFRVDVRGVRYPGIISYASAPGGGTTDYAVEIFHAALARGSYTAFVREDCVLPMMYMPDCIDAALKLMAADGAALRHRNAFNVGAMSFSVGDLAREISRHVPGFQCSYEPDERQQIADTWPRSVDDRAAREEWGWSPGYGLERMTSDMLTHLRAIYDGAGKCQC